MTLLDICIAFCRQTSFDRPTATETGDTATIPQEITLPGICSNNAPVPFLRNVNSACLRQMTLDSCTANTAFDYRSYTTVHCSNKTKQRFISLQHEFVSGQRVEYACAQATTGPQLRASDTEHLFADNYDARPLVSLKGMLSKTKRSDRDKQHRALATRLQHRNATATYVRMLS